MFGSSSKRKSAKVIDLAKVSNYCEMILDRVKLKKASIVSFLQEGYPLSLEDNTLVIEFPKNLLLYKTLLNTNEHKEVIGALSMKS